MKRTAVLYAGSAPSEAQRARFEAFLKNKYGEEIELEYRESELFPGGFRLEVGAEIYDWSVNWRFRQLRDTLTQVAGEEGSIIPLIKDTIGKWTPEAVAEEVGSVRAVGDGIAVADGLAHAEYGEILLFSDGIRGMVQTRDKDPVGCILLGEDWEPAVRLVTYGPSCGRG